MAAAAGGVLNAFSHRTEREADRAPRLLHPVAAAYLDSFIAVPAPSRREIQLRETLNQLAHQRKIASAIVDLRQTKLDEGLRRLHELDLRIDDIDAELDELTGQGRR